MASLTKTVGKRGTTWRIEFFDANNKRKCIRLGKIDKRQAESIKARVELLVAARITGTSPDVETSRWVADRDDTLHARLAQHELVAARGTAESNTLAKFLDAYIESRTDIKPNTRAHLKRARNNLVSYFGADKSLAEISPGDADDFRLHLQTTMADNTVRRICGRAKQFFRAAVRKRLIAESPFADMKGTGVRANKSRDYFVTRDDAAKVLNACPDAQWKLLFALSRFGGLRCPSEHLELRWGDVDWDRERITVRSPKTAHHEDHEERVIPLFPELRPYLEAVRDELFADRNFDPKANRLSEQPIITRYRDRNSNLRTQLERIIRKAGLQPWPKLFQNLRAMSRPTGSATARRSPTSTTVKRPTNTSPERRPGHKIMGSRPSRPKKRSSQRRNVGEMIGTRRKENAKPPRNLISPEKLKS